MSEVTLKSHLEDSHFRLEFAGTKEVKKVGILVGKPLHIALGGFSRLSKRRRCRDQSG